MLIRCGARLTLWHVIAFALMGSTGPAWSQSEAVPLPSQEPRQPQDCVTEAAAYHSVDPWTLRAILQVESRFNTNAVNRTANGTTDVGIAQINSMHFRELGKFGIAPADLLNGCVASYVAAWHLRKQIIAYGNTWYAIGAYHSTTPCFNQRYTGLVWNALKSWGVVNGPSVTPIPISRCSAGAGVGAVKSAPSRANNPPLLALD